MRLLQIDDSGEFSLVKYVGRDIPPYAILSHTWGADYEEVTFRDLVEGAGKSKAGYRKLSFCGKQAASDGLRFFWVDTCCINKENTVELSDAINSMFEWYRNATRCYVYLSDVSTTAFASNKEEKLTKYMPLQSNWTSMVGISNEEDNPSLWDSDFRKSKWFTRGWTLQELLAPSSLEFFSKEGQRLGDKSSLVGPIHSITGIPEPTLQGAPLSQISVNKRLSWMEHRETKLEEDKAYSLLGIFGVYIPPIYGEGKARAYKRLLDEIEKLEKCMQHIRLTDPRDDKKRIEDTKGGLLKDSYRWILENSEFQKWRNDQQSQLLWIKGDPGKGKTMLLCGIISELNKSMAKKHHLAYFFCQATDSRINNATAVLRGLLYFMVDQQPLLVSHVRKKYDHAGKALFEDINAWVALKEIFISILQDPSLVRTYLVIDALDECVAGLPKLLELVVLTSTMSPCVKWIVSSRNWTEIERYLGSREQSLQLSLELNATSISTAVDSYIQHKVSHIAQERQYNDEVRGAVLNHLSSNANSTFLWVALVCQLLEKIPRWKVLAKLNAFPPKLDSIYERMMQQVRCSDDVDLCKQILASIAIVYRPITLAELTSCVEMLQDMANDQESIQEIVSLCGSFLTIREDTVYFVHQSAKDFLLDKAFNDIFPFGMQEAHHKVFSRSLQVMDRTLQRDMYNLRAVGCPIEQVKRPDPDPLEASYYSCIYWVDHLCDWITSSSTEHQVSLQDGEIIDEFMRTKYLYWLEALSLSRSMSHGVVSMAKLVASIPVIANYRCYTWQTLILPRKEQDHLHLPN